MQSGPDGDNAKEPERGSSAFGSWSASLVLPGAPTGNDGLDLDSAAETHVAAQYGFAAGGRNLLLGSETPCEVVDAERVSRLPYTPGWLLGLLNVRGNLVPVFDLHALPSEMPSANCGPNERATGRVFFLVVDRGERMAAFVSEDLPKAVRTHTLQRVPVPSLDPLMRPHVTGAVSADGTTWLTFDHRSFLEAMSASMAGA